MVFIKHKSPKSDVFFNPLFHVFQDPRFLGSRFFRVKVFWVHVFQGLEIATISNWKFGVPLKYFGVPGPTLGVPGPRSHLNIFGFWIPGPT